MINTPPRPVSIYPILSVNFVGTLGFSIVLPFLVFLVTRLGGNALVYGVPWAQPIPSSNSSAPPSLGECRIGTGEGVSFS